MHECYDIFLCKSEFRGRALYDRKCFAADPARTRLVIYEIAPDSYMLDHKGKGSRFGPGGYFVAGLDRHGRPAPGDSHDRPVISPVPEVYAGHEPFFACYYSTIDRLRSGQLHCPRNHPSLANFVVALQRVVRELFP